MLASEHAQETLSNNMRAWSRACTYKRAGKSRSFSTSRAFYSLSTHARPVQRFHYVSMKAASSSAARSYSLKCVAAAGRSSARLMKIILFCWDGLRFIRVQHLAGAGSHRDAKVPRQAPLASDSANWQGIGEDPLAIVVQVSVATGRVFWLFLWCGRIPNLSNLSSC